MAESESKPVGASCVLPSCFLAYGVAGTGGAVAGFTLSLLPQISPATKANVKLSLSAQVASQWPTFLFALALGAAVGLVVCTLAQTVAPRRGLAACFGPLLFQLICLLWFTPLRTANFQMLIVFVFIISTAACAARLASAVRIPSNWGRDRICRIALVLLMAAHFATFSFLSFSKFDRLQCDMYDLGIHDSMTWHATRGHPFRDFRGPYDHFSPIVLAYVPIYFLWPSPKALLAVQSLVVVLGCWPLYQLARLRLRSPVAGLSVAAAYLLYPLLSRVELYDFHPMLFVPPIFFAACLALFRRHTRSFLFWLVVCLCVKEGVAILVFGLGLFILLGMRRWRLGAAVCVLAVAWSIWVTKIYFPLFVGTQYPHYGRYRTLLAQGRVIAGACERVVFALRSHFIWRTALMVVVPVGFFPLASVSGFAFLAAIPMAEQFLSENTPQQLLKAHYSASIIAGALVAAVYGIELFVKRGNGGQRLRFAVAFLLASALLSNYFFGDDPFKRYAHNDAVNYNYGNHGRLWSFSLDLGRYRPGWHEEIFHAFRKLLPQDASVMAQDNLACYVSQRERISMPQPGQNYDFYLHDAKTYFPGGNDARNKRVFDEVVGRKDYRPFFVWDGFEFFARGDQWHEVVKAGEAALQRRPGDIATRFAVARILFQKGELDRAENHLRRLANRRPFPSGCVDVFWMLADIAVRSGHAEDAIRAYRRGLSISEVPRARYCLGLLYARIGNVDAAKECLRRAVNSMKADGGLRQRAREALRALARRRAPAGSRRDAGDKR